MVNYNHAEAFALMWYGCECGHRERIWNSRDGVTPFGGVFCPSCDNTGTRGLTHLGWGADECKPDHKLAVGQRFFRDGTSIDAVKIIERRIARTIASGMAVPLDTQHRLLRDAREQTGEWHEGWPMVDRRGEDNA